MTHMAEYDILALERQHSSAAVAGYRKGRPWANRRETMNGQHIIKRSRVPGVVVVPPSPGAECMRSTNSDGDRGS